MIKVVYDGCQVNGWKMIVLGSDYDGLVDFISFFLEVNSFQELWEELIYYLNVGEEIYFFKNGEVQVMLLVEVR